MNHSCIEILEARIAPATFLVSSVDLSVTNPANPAYTPSAAEISANAAAGASAAVFLVPGDRLVFDANHDGIAGASEPLLASVVSGKAYAFLYDADGDEIGDVCDACAAIAYG